MDCGSADDDRHPTIVRVVANVLERLINGHTNSPKCGAAHGYGFLKFQSSYAPEVSIESYLTRIRKYSRCSDACVVMALVYIDRLIESKSLVLTNLNVHRLLITSVMLSAKFHDDLFYNNAYYSKLGGISLQELNHLEIELLQLLDNSLFIKATTFEKYMMQLQNFVNFLDIDEVQQSPVSVVDQGYPTVAPVHSLVTLGSIVGGERGARIPSPHNPHEACTFGEYSPCRIGPAPTTPPRNPLYQTALIQQRQPTFSARKGCWPQSELQNHFQQDGSYNQGADPYACNPYSVIGGTSAASGGSYVYHSNAPTMSCSAPAVLSLRDSADDNTTTSCSTRTCSPYAPANYSRSCSANSSVISGPNNALINFPMNGNQNLTAASYQPAHGLLSQSGGLLEYAQGIPAMTGFSFAGSGRLAIETEFPLDIEGFPQHQESMSGKSVDSCRSVSYSSQHRLGGLCCSTGGSLNNSTMSVGGGLYGLQTALAPADDTESAACDGYLTSSSSMKTQPYNSTTTIYDSQAQGAYDGVHHLPQSYSAPNAVSPMNESELLTRYKQYGSDYALSQLYANEALASMNAFSIVPPQRYSAWC